ncbi:hypothetical protein C8Q73DRAFT_693446 [Cubamyces lactineus]|nr:hypothetical protein C8Q73DRAFT_693446 [Cubamyces lactineus]
MPLLACTSPRPFAHRVPPSSSSSSLDLSDTGLRHIPIYGLGVDGRNACLQAASEQSPRRQARGICSCVLPASLDLGPAHTQCMIDERHPPLPEAPSRLLLRCVRRLPTAPFLDRPCLFSDRQHRSAPSSWTSSRRLSYTTSHPLCTLRRHAWTPVSTAMTHATQRLQLQPSVSFKPNPWDPPQTWQSGNLEHQVPRSRVISVSWSSIH